jgi:hypothetical protein
MLNAEVNGGIGFSKWPFDIHFSIQHSAFSISSTPRVQAVEVKDRVEHERIAADRSAAVHRIEREQHDMPLPIGTCTMLNAEC